MSKKVIKIGIILTIALVIRLFLHNFLTYSADLGTFIAWGRKLQAEGFATFYQQWSDYLPGYLYILWFVAGLEKILPVTATLLYKLPAILADVGVGYLIYKIVAEKVNKKTALMFASLFLFNPAVLANSTLWGQVDILTVLFSLLAVFIFKRKWLLSAIFLALGVLIKPQAALAAPVILLLMTREKWSLMKMTQYALVSLLVIVILFVPFSSGNIFSFIVERFQSTISQYPYTSINAFNFWGLGGFWKPDTSGTITSSTLGLLITVISSITAFWYAWRKKLDPYLLLAFLFGIHFMFFTRMHERHLLPILAPLLISAASNRKLLISYLGFSVTYLANLWYSYYWTLHNFASPFPDSMITFLILMNLVFLVWLLIAPHVKIRWKWNNKQEMKEEVYFAHKYGRRLLVWILVFTAVTRLLNLGSPPKEYFDEVYHAFTARIISEGDPKAWEWWNPHPEGFAYEWTHPPFAKLAMAGSMLLFGENSIAWRLPEAIFGVGVVYLVYLIGKELFKNEEIGLIAAALVSLDGLVLVMSRIGMNDIYLLFFSLLSFYWFLKEKYLWSSVAFGFAISSKWSAMWLLPLLVVMFISYRRKLKLTLVSFVVFPPLIYLANYIPMFVTGHGLDIWWGMQKQMWWYHTQLKAEHGYSSAAWSWPLLLRPVWLYVDRVGETVANIYAMSNPIIIWGGLISVVLGIYELFLKKNKALGIAIFGWMIFFVPWVVSPRIMFYYHYLPAIPFLALITAYVLRQEPKALKVFLALSLVVFLYFYPHWTGIHIPNWFSETYYWLPSWR